MQDAGKTITRLEEAEIFPLSIFFIEIKKTFLQSWQFKIGSYVAEGYWKNVGSQMMGIVT